MKKPIYTTLPVSLCEFALVNRKVNHLIVYIYLKHISSGHVNYNTSLYKLWAKELGLNEKTIRSCVKWLIKKKWITVNNERKSLRIISYKQLLNKLRLNKNSAVIFEPENFLNFSSFCCGAVITQRYRYLRWKNKNRSVQKIECTSKSRKLSNKYVSVPLGFIANCLNVGLSKANLYLKTMI